MKELDATDRETKTALWYAMHNFWNFVDDGGPEADWLEERENNEKS